MVRKRVPIGCPGDWDYVWYKGTQDDVVEFTSEIILLKEKYEIDKK